MKRWILRLSVLFSFLYIFSACDDDDRTTVSSPGNSISNPTVVQIWNIAVSPSFLNPANPDSLAIGQARLTLFNDNTLEYTLANAGIASGDRLTIAQIRMGDPTTNGSTIVGLVNDEDMQFDSENDYVGTLQLTAAEAGGLQEEAYVWIASEDNPDGLLRGQLNETILFASDVSLSPNNVVPAVTGRNETGMALIRITDANTVYYKIEIDDLESSDQITTVTINEGSTGANGTLLVDLVGTVVDGELAGSVAVTDTDAIETIETGQSYILISSEDEAAGLLRGQIDESSTLIPSIDREWEIALSPRLEVPALTDRNETGTASLILLTNNQLVYTLVVNDLADGDALTVAHIHSGNPVTNGGVFVTLADGDNLSFGDANSINQIIQLTDEQADALRNEDALYINIHSSQEASGLVRGQINEVIQMASDVSLSPSNEVPPITDRDETGMAILRLTADSLLYFDISVNDLASSDSLTMAHIHEGAAGATGGVIFDFLEDNAFTDNTLVGVDTASSDAYTDITTQDTYVNIHSEEEPSGLLRGQVNTNRVVLNSEGVFE